MADTFNLIFFPVVKEPAEEEKIKSMLVATLKVDAEKVDGWFASGKPTLLLKNVEHQVGDRYMQAIIKCGANCNLEPSADTTADISLVVKPKERRKSALFVCPSCDFEKRVQGDLPDECPECGSIIAEHIDHKVSEEESEAIRQRILSRDVRVEDQDESEEKRKRSELKQLRLLEQEIMLDLGIKHAGRFWQFYSNHPYSISGAGALLIVAASMTLSLFVNISMDSGKKDALLAEAPTTQIQGVAPLIAASVNLMQGGKQTVIHELALTTQLLQGRPGTQPQIISAAEQMMKGADPRPFMQSTENILMRSSQTPAGPDEPKSSKVNLGTLGGVTGITGVPDFTDRQLAGIFPRVELNGPDKLLRIIARPPVDPDRNDGRSELEILDGSTLADIMAKLSLDYEWDLYLIGFVRNYLKSGLIAHASDLAESIENPLTKISALSGIMAAQISRNNDADIESDFARLRSEIRILSDPDASVRLRLSLGELLASSGASEEPDDTLAYLEKLVTDTPDPYRKSIFAARFAGTQLPSDRASARKHFNIALRSAGRISSTAKRLSAFIKLAQRYFDARNITLASEIIAEAQIVAATRLKTVERSIVFAEIAYAQLYMGDTTGALLSVENAAVAGARDQLLGKLTEVLIGEGKIHQARDLLTRIDDVVEFHRVVLRLATYTLYSGETASAELLLEQSGQRLQEIKEPELKTLILSHYGRMYVRLNQTDVANKHFDEALALVDGLTGRTKAVARGMVAFNQARALMISQSKETLELVTDGSIKEPVYSIVTATNRIITDLLPE